MRKSVEVRTSTKIILDDMDIERIIADEIRAKHHALFPDNNMTVEVTFDVSSGHVLRGATATVTRYDRSEEDL